MSILDTKEMLSVTRLDGHTTVNINYSSLDLIMTCPRKAYYALHRRLRSDDESAALVFGSAIHKALECYYSLPFETRTLPKNAADKADHLVWGNEVEDADNGCMRAITAFRERALSLESLGTDDKRSLNNGAKILIKYFQTYANDGFIVVNDKHGPIVERRVSFEIFNSKLLTINYFGTIDAILKNEKTGIITVVDHKTTSALGKEFYNQIKPNHQYTGYVIGAQRFLGIDTDMFMVNGIQVAKTLHTFARQFTNRTIEDYLSLAETVIYAVANYMHASEQNAWPMNAPKPCTMYGGCTYHRICSVPVQLRENVLKASFTEPTPCDKSEIEKLELT